MNTKDITHPGDFKKCLRAFSLIELMISLIAISLITAAFAPVISKRLSSSEFTIGVGSGGSSANMADWVTDCGHVNTNCMYCLPQGDCQMCDLNCGIKYKNVEKCICEECNTKFDNCSECNRVECTKCETGYYVLNGRCTKTHAGSYSPDGINEELCPEGYYCEQGTQPQTCPSGTYSNKGAKSQSDCKSCEQGFACKDGIKSECSAGHYSKSGASVCTNCDSYNSSNSAYYSTGTKNNTCTLCEAGNMCVNGSKTSCDNPTYATQGSTYCADCENCTECDNKTGTCTKCKEGYYINNNKCVPCTTGYYCPGGSDSTRHECPSACSSCTSSTNCTGCRATYQLDNNGSCNPCPEGYYCSGGVASAQGCVSSCKSCSNTSTCDTCNNGYYINTSSTCTQCEAGYMCPNGQTRTSCDAGKYQNEKGQTSCKTCSTATGTANTTCGCSAGYYGDGVTCTPCRAGTYNPLASQTESSACLNCNNNFGEGYGSDQGATTCVRCGANCSYCSSSSTCATCTREYYSNNGVCTPAATITSCNTSYCVLSTGLSMYRYNVGNTNGPLPNATQLKNAGISTCNVGFDSKCSFAENTTPHTPTCWVGNMDANSSTTYSSYSAASRTVCNWYAAKKACSYIGWRLATSSDLVPLGRDLSRLCGDRSDWGLMFCSFTTATGMDYCPGDFCNGKSYSNCWPGAMTVVGSDGSPDYRWLFYNTAYLETNATKGHYATSRNTVRCVK